MGFKYINRPRGGSSRAFDAEVLAWRDAVILNGGSVSLSRLIIVDQFVFSERASGAWTLTDDYWALWAENAIQALTSLKQRRLATMVNSPSFTPDRGYAFNGTTQYVDTGFIPSTHAAVMTATSARIEAYERDNVATNTYAAGVADASNKRLTVSPRDGGGTRVYGEANAAAATFVLSGADSRGLTAVSRNGGTAADCVAYKNGVAITRATDPAGFGATLPVVSVFIGGFNAAGVLSNPRASSIGFVSCGAALSVAQELAHYNAVQEFASAVGAQV